MKYFNIDSFEDFLNKFNDNLFDYVIIQVSASWCKPCQLIKNDYKEFIENNEEKNACCLIIDYDIIEEDDDFNTYLTINKIPYFIIYYRKNKIKEFQCSDIDQIKHNIQYEINNKNMENFDISDDF